MPPRRTVKVSDAATCRAESGTSTRAQPRRPCLARRRTRQRPPLRFTEFNESVEQVRQRLSKRVAAGTSDFSSQEYNDEDTRSRTKGYGEYTAVSVATWPAHSSRPRLVFHRAGHCDCGRRHKVARSSAAGSAAAASAGRAGSSGHGGHGSR